MSERRTEKEVGEGLNPGLSKVQMEALFGEVTRMVRAELELLHDRMSRLEVSASGGKPKSKKCESEFEGEDEFEEHSENWGRNK
ncbi:BAG family molecular chaperone regulator 4 [Dorcoceras hygrometricum]|uniref:BAG family molecular chaperone regulator 4 n=1 Tax=Dorcoceras hygrometricum TaxID=472368 RepID=A0A2Z7BRA8_9LAMI|nr:BAG family molecular chaperone regulator 4 [Dorcoceras hygrometricum]